VGVAENPRSGVGARGSGVESGLSWAQSVHPMTSTALPLLNLLTVKNYPDFVVVSTLLTFLQKFFKMYNYTIFLYFYANICLRFRGFFSKCG
jgi:hypothetical protein